MVNELSPLIFNQDMFNNILASDKSNLLAFSCVNKMLVAMAQQFAKIYRPEGCFGKAQWLSHVETEEEPLLPLKMIQEFNTSKYMLTFIPETINGIFLSLYSIDMFFRKLKKSKTSIYADFPNHLQLHKIPLEKLNAHWIMVSKEIFSGNMGIGKQEDSFKKNGFEIANLIDTVLTLVLHNFCYPPIKEHPTSVFVKEYWDDFPIKITTEANQKLKIVYWTRTAHNTGVAASWKSPQPESTKPFQ